jgi:hypothetical protein
MSKSTAPWTAEQIENINRYQHSGVFHEFTCGSGNRTDEKHLDGNGTLVATEEGLHCPYCDYKQDWVHEFMANFTQDVLEMHPFYKMYPKSDVNK